MSDVVINVVESATNVTVTEQDVAVDVTETVVEVSASTAGLQGASYVKGDPIYVTVTNKTGATLPKGSIVYTSGANGTHTQVSLALATSDATSARCLGWLSESIANNADGFCMVEGYLDGVNTQGIAEGSQLYLSGTVAGGFTATKPQAPIHLVYVGVTAKASAGNGRVYVKVQNGYELDELHDVKIDNPVNNQVLTYDSATDLWVNATNPADGVTSITATAPLTGGTITSTGSIGLDQTALNIAQSQVTNLVSDLAGKANLAGGNAFTGAQTITASTATQVPLTLVAASGQTANLLSTAGGARIPAAGNYFIAPGITSTFVADFNAGSTTTTPVTIAGLSGQTANLLRLAVAGTDVAVVTSTGTFRSAGLITAGSSTDVLGQLSVITTVNSRIGAVIRGAASQSANLQEWQNSAASVLARVEPTGKIVGGQNITALGSIHSFNIMTSGTNEAQLGSATLSIGTRAAGNIGAVIRGAASQTANLTEWQESNAGVPSAVTAFGGFRVRTFGTTVADTSLAVFAGYAAEVPIRVRGAVSQTADLLQIQDSGANTLLNITSAGNLNAPGQIRVGTTAGLAQLSVVSTNAATIAQVVRGAASQTASLTQWQNNAGGLVATMSAAGDLALYGNGITSGDHRVGTATYLSATLNVITRATTEKGLVIRGLASQTANLTEWQNSAATILSRVEASGKGVFDVLNAPNGAFFGNLTAQPGSPSAYLAVQGYSPQHRPFMVRGFGAMTANLVDYQNGASVVVSGINGVGQTFTGSTAPATSFVGGVTTATSGDGTTATITTTAAHNLAIGDIVTITGITPTGYNGRFSVTAVTSTTLSYANATTGSQTVAGAVSVEAQATIVSRSGGTRGLIIRGASGQAVPPLSVQDNGGTTLAQISSAGNVQANGLTTLTSHVVINEANSGGQINVTRQTAAAANPGANIGRIYFRDGTTPGTLRLVVRAGTAGAETTILDNIPQ
jgi:hypothetical protein